MMETRSFRFGIVIALAATVVCIPTSGFAAPILFPTVASFAVLGASAVTNTGPTTLTGNLGVSNNSSPTGITGFFGTLANDGPGTFSGAVHQGDAYTILADEELVAAMTLLSLMGPGELLPEDLTGLIIHPGVYTVPAAVSNLTGEVTLDGLGNPNALWVFLMTSTLITSPGSAVTVINVGSGAGAGVYWNVGSSATLDTTTTFAGNILASTSITLNNGVTINCGRALAHTGAVTLINDTLSIGCASTEFENSDGFNGGQDVVPTAVPEPASMVLLGSGLAAAMWKRRRSGLVQR